MFRLSLNEYKDRVSLNPELTAIVRKEGKRLFLISDMEYGGDFELLRVEHMFFQLDMALPFQESIVECRDRHAGGIAFPIENCSTFDEAFDFFIAQSSSDNYYAVNNITWANVMNLSFEEIFIVVNK